jgi:phosphonate transport system substrate-binding protein
MRRRNLVKYSLLFIAGCTARLNANGTEQSKVIFPQSLKFAVTDVIGLAELKRDFEDFRSALEEVLNIKVEFFPVENRTAATPALLAGKVDIVFAGPSEYIILNARAKAVPIIGIRRKDYHSIFLVRADSKITSLAQLRGKTIALRKIGSTSGHIVPTKILLDAGLDPKKDVNIVMLDKKGASALKQGKVDAWTISSDRYQHILAEQGLSAKDFKIIFKSNLLPSDLFVASNQLAPDFITKMRSLMIQNQAKLISSLLTAKNNQSYIGSELVTVNDSEYNIIREFYQNIGQDSFLK